MFYYVIKNGLWGGISVSPDTITAYDRVTSSIKIEELPPEIAFLFKLSLTAKSGKNPKTDVIELAHFYMSFQNLRQCASAFEGKRYRFLEQDHIGHELPIRSLHPKSAPQALQANNSHVHIVLDDLVTPKRFACFIEQIIREQSNLTARAELSQSMEVSLARQVTQRNLGRPITEDYTNPLIDPADAENAVTAYEEYFQKNQLRIERAYNQTQQALKDLTWSDEIADLSAHAYQAAKYSFLMSLTGASLNEILSAAKLSAGQRHLLISTLNFSVAAYNTGNYLPLLLCCGVAFLMTNHPNLQANGLMFLSLITTVMALVGLGIPKTGYETLQVGVSFASASIAATAGVSIIKVISQTIFPQVNPQADSNETQQQRGVSRPSAFN